MKRILFTLALLLAPGVASAQCNGVFPNGTICGNITGTPNLPRPVSNSALTGIPGGTNGQTQFNNNGIFGGYTPSGDISVATATGVETIQPGVITTGKIATSGVSNINLAPGPANSVKGTVNGTTTSDLAIASCSAVYQFTQWVTGTGWQCGINPVIPSRAIAATLNLSAFTAVTTQGYATPGDGGGAMFFKNGTAPFTDSFISTGFINQAGTGCTNGTYTGVFLAGGTGDGGAVATIVVSGGSVTSLSLNASPGSGYTVADQLTQNGAFTCSGNVFNWQVSAVTSPNGSFTDTAGNHWQYTPNGGYIYATQFGVKPDWTPAGGDAGATNNTTPIQSAMNYAAAGSPQLQAAGGFIGQQVILPKGGIMTCAINVPPGVWLRGIERYATLLKACDVLPTTSHFVTLCDPNTLSACIAARFSDLTMFPGMGTPVAGTSFIFTNNDQEEGDELQHLSIQSGLRECIHLSVGYGGAASFGMHEIECGPSELSTNVGIYIEYASALVPMHNILVSTGPTGPFQYGIDYIDGYVDINMYNAENVQRGIFMNNTTSNGSMRVHNMTCGARCVYAITRQTSTLANVSVAGFITGGSSGTLNNAGTITTGQIIADQVF